jgi:hypothetical protein
LRHCEGWEQKSARREQTKIYNGTKEGEEREETIDKESEEK